MSLVKWGASIARGCTAAMSAERARLMVQLEQLSRAPDESFAAGYIELVAFLEREMRTEEAALESINFKALRSHQEQHARVLSALHHAAPAVEDGNVVLGREALALLARWLEVHRATTDLALLTALTPMGRRRPFTKRKPDGDRRQRPPSQPDRRAAAQL